ncbi:hypothetical protein [Rhodoferax sp.]|uniref:hypothetical protein n=1 Tax=Rhodoferax sp. TaxID=50421 RepID=UPI0028445A97|nr:hypothetical protein [Rhodoferax sp.]MDR3370691.1 hypothetical protein [Rhodoferax sp.]
MKIAPRTLALICFLLLLVMAWGYQSWQRASSGTHVLVKSAAAACGDSDAPAIEALVKDEIGVSSVQKICSNSLAYVNNKPIDTPMYRVEVTFNTGGLWGSSQDFNGLADDTMRVARNAFKKAPTLEWIRFNAVESSGKNWAIVELKRSELPADWMALTYLQKMSYASLDVPYLQPRPWVCEFYKKYPSATAKRGSYCS